MRKRDTKVKWLKEKGPLQYLSRVKIRTVLLVSMMRKIKPRIWRKG